MGAWRTEEVVTPWRPRLDWLRRALQSGRLAPWRVVGLCSATVAALGTAALVWPRPAVTWGLAPLREAVPVQATMARRPVAGGVAHRGAPGGQGGDAVRHGTRGGQGPAS